MANTVNIKNGVTMLSAVDTDYAPGQLFVKRICFSPAAIGDRCVIKEGADDGPEIFNHEAVAATDRFEQSYDRLLNPMLDVSAGSYNAGAKVVIITE